MVGMIIYFILSYFYKCTVNNIQITRQYTYIREERGIEKKNEINIV